MRYLGGRRIEQPACRPRAQVGTLAGPRNWPRSAQRNERPWHVLRKYKVSIGIQKLIPDLRPYRRETSNANQRDRLASIPQYVREVRRIFHTVQWAHCLEGCVEAGASVFFELGPGRALNEMAAGAYPDISARSLADFRTLQGARAWLARVVN